MQINPIGDSNLISEIEVEFNKQSYHITSTIHLTKEELIGFALEALENLKTRAYKQERTVAKVIKKAEQMGEINQKIILTIVHITEATSPLSSKRISDEQTIMPDELGEIATRGRADAVSKNFPPPLSFTTERITSLAINHLGMKDSIAKRGAHLIARELDSQIRGLAIESIKNQDDLRVTLIKMFKKNSAVTKLIDKATFAQLLLKKTAPEFINAPEYRSALKAYASGNWREGVEKVITFTYFNDDEVQDFSHVINLFFQDPKVRSALEPFCPSYKKAPSPLASEKPSILNKKGPKQKLRSTHFYHEAEVRTKDVRTLASDTFPIYTNFSDRVDEYFRAGDGDSVRKEIEAEFEHRNEAVPDSSSMSMNIEFSNLLGNTNVDHLQFTYAALNKMRTLAKENAFPNREAERGAKLVALELDILVQELSKTKIETQSKQEKILLALEDALPKRIKKKNKKETWIDKETFRDLIYRGNIEDLRRATEYIGVNAIYEADLLIKEEKDKKWKIEELKKVTFTNFNNKELRKFDKIIAEFFQDKEVQSVLKQFFPIIEPISSNPGDAPPLI